MYVQASPQLVAWAIFDIQFLQRHIAQTLSASKSAVWLRLNLDFPGDPGEFNPDVGSSALEQWRRQLATFASEILEMLAQGPTLRGIALLYHGEPPSMWVWYYRTRHGKIRRVYDRSPKRR